MSGCSPEIQLDSREMTMWIATLDARAAVPGRTLLTSYSRGRVVLDLIHALGYPWKAAYVFRPEGSIEAVACVTERLLLNGDAGQVIASIRRAATCTD